MAKKGDLKTVLHMNVGLDEALAKAVDTSAAQHERTHNQEVRYVLRQYYGIDRAPVAEVEADAVPA
jgi:hypothetical protein